MHLCKMFLISLLCLTSLRIIRAFDGESCPFIENSRVVKLNRTATTIAYIEQILSANKKQCESLRPARNVKWPVLLKCYVNSKCSVTFKQIHQYKMYTYRNISFQCTSCSSTGAGKTVAITCPSTTEVEIDDGKYGGSNIPVDGIPNYAFIFGGIVGVFFIICIIAGVFLLREHNCSKCRNTQRKSKEKVMPALNPTYNPTGRPNKQEHDHQAYIVDTPEAIHISTDQAVYFDNRTDDKGINFCHIQQPGIQTKLEESNTYSHLRTTVDDSDVMYDHTIHHAVHETCEGDYGITHRRITEDEYDVSGSFQLSTSKNEDPVYT